LIIFLKFGYISILRVFFMKSNKLTTILLTSLIINSSSVLAQYQPPFQASYQPQYQAQVSYVPAGTPITVTMNDTLGSEFTQVGERFTATLAGPIYSGRDLVAGPGSVVEGTVVEINPAGRAGKPASMNLRVNNLVTPDGRRIPLSASIDQETFKLSAEGGVTSNLVKSSVVGAGAGGLSGLVGAAISGGKKGKATAIGTGIGAGTGLLVGAFKKGNDLIVERGSQVNFKLDQPLQGVNTAPPVQRFPSDYGVGAPPMPGSSPYQDSGVYQQQTPNPYLQY
jgi:hypothetical protein